MLSITIELLHGTFRADPDGSAHTGQLKEGEWPPSPSRLYSALVAADGTRDRLRVTSGRELEWFERLPPPVIHAHSGPCHQPLHPRFVVEARRRFATSTSKTKDVLTHLEYIGRSGAEVRPGVRVSPRFPKVVYLWDTSCPSEVLDALQLRAARVGYLGTADSPVRVRVQDAVPESLEPAEAFRPDAEGSVYIRVPQAGDLDMLDSIYDAWLKRGVGLARAQYPSLWHEARYRSPAAPPSEDRGSVVAWLRLRTAISGRRVGAVTSLFKKAVLAKHQRLYGEPPAILHGHGFKGPGYDLARYLALPDVGHRWSRGRIHGLALWVPPGCDRVVRNRARQSARIVRRLAGRGLNTAVRPHAGERRPDAARPGRWTRGARSWVTVFPAVHERHVPLDLAEVTKWCKHAGYPAPVSFRSTRTPLIHGGVDLAPVEVNRPGRPGPPYSHLQIWFAKKVLGPVVIGSARQRGLGLCVSCREGESSND